MSGVSSSIHFRGITQVLQAYQDRNVDTWSLWQGRQFLTKGQDMPSLAAFLEMLSSSQSTAVYTVKVYEEVPDLKKLKSTTADDGSFNFRLRDPEEYLGGAPFRGQQWGAGVTERIEAIERNMALLLERSTVEEEEEEEEAPAGIMGAITGLLSDPDKLLRLMEVGRSLLGGTPARPAYMGSVNRLGSPDPESGNGGGAVPLSSPEVKLERLGAAIDILDRCDPLLTQHLEKLAKLAAGNPAQFQTLIGMLDVL